MLTTAMGKQVNHNSFGRPLPDTGWVTGVAKSMDSPCKRRGDFPYRLAGQRS
ncbi:hypothetical protein J5X98_17215 [Leptothermofonsia sichuanensis E412]|uniref:hypothetical protein n=1 Tax=Leptothermofonsia sichuanensis TaxID=2917832 RepID=UPI001CA72D58|nr:hypothetical protein [Leptothermofonsia sichuanensis]QZZ19144.1 hypothetical protein J5X98_17215 [Leptothermofonsia sichuanensis E412]